MELNKIYGQKKLLFSIQANSQTYEGKKTDESNGDLNYWPQSVKVNWIEEMKSN